MDRRKFLKCLTAGAGVVTVTVVAGKFVWDIVRKPLPPQDVIVIGGGLSGLTAAYLLTKEGKKVTVLEASHRPGGRVGTWRWPNGQYNDVGSKRSSMGTRRPGGSSTSSVSAGRQKGLGIRTPFSREDSMLSREVGMSEVT